MGSTFAAPHYSVERGIFFVVTTGQPSTTAPTLAAGWPPFMSGELDWVERSVMRTLRAEETGYFDQCLVAKSGVETIVDSFFFRISILV